MVWLLLPLALLWLWVSVPLLTGSETLFFRDVHSGHIVYKFFGAEQLKQGQIPVFQDDRALGQPFRGNPNTLSFYPGNLAYLVLPFFAAFHLHFVAHWLLAFAAMWMLARRLGQSPEAAVGAAGTYALGGWMLSGFTFYNILTVSAWWPLVLWGMVDGDRRGLAVGGAACGLAFLGGDPITLVIGLAPLAWLAWHRHGLKGGSLRLVGLGGLALTVALPQIVATLRILDATRRGSVGEVTGAEVLFSFAPLRWLELLIPFPLGPPTLTGPGGFWTVEGVSRVPFIFTVHLGIVGLLLLVAVLKRRAGWQIFAWGGLVTATLGGLDAELLRRLTFGLFRYPEKFLFWLALAASLLIGFGVDAWSKSEAPKRRWLAVPVLLGSLGGLLLLTKGPFLAAVASSGAVAGAPDPAAVLLDVRLHVEQWAGSLLWSAFLALLWWLLLCRAASSTGRRVGLVALQLLCLAPPALVVLSQLAGPADTFAPSPLMDTVESGSAVVSTQGSDWLGLDLKHDQISHLHRTVRAWVVGLGSTANVVHGLSYPLATDHEGLHTLRSGLVAARLRALDGPQRVPWLRRLGVDYLVSSEPLDGPQLEPAARHEAFGVTFHLYRVAHSAPAVWWPETVRQADGPSAAFEVLNSQDMDIVVVEGRSPVEHHPGATVTVLESGPDGLVMEVDGDGGVVAVRRAYFPIWRARAGDQDLSVLPLDVCLTGVVVPPGRHRVVLDVSSWPETAAGILAVLALLGACALARPRSGRSSAQRMSNESSA